jgi:hypothetical protein
MPRTPDRGCLPPGGLAALSGPDRRRAFGLDVTAELILPRSAPRTSPRRTS